MTSSCCPAFVELVKKHFPADADKISETVSPMVAAGRYAKAKFGADAKTCFIGPCIAKKEEQRQNADAIDFVLTFEELLALFDGTGIQPSKMRDAEFVPTATAGGIGFPLNRGVQSSVVAVLGKRGAKIAAEYAAGLERCHDTMHEIVAGKNDAAYFEGMACSNGCIDGPGALSQFGLTRTMVTRYAAAAAQKASDDAGSEAAIYADKLDLAVHEAHNRDIAPGTRLPAFKCS